MVNLFKKSHQSIICDVYILDVMNKATEKHWCIAFDINRSKNND